MKNRFTVVVSSCDKYEDLWDPFFRILKAEWPRLEREQITIILNTEHKTFCLEGLNIKTLQLYDEDEASVWTERLRRTLESIETDYIIHILDDFFLNDKVRDDIIDRCVKWMDDRSGISMFCFKETYVSKNIRDNRYEGFERRPLFGQYKFNCQAALWRRTRLINYLKKNENPWEWEEFGNWRSYRHPFHLFYSHIPGGPRVFPYIYEAEGSTFWESGVYRGKWVLPSVDPVFKMHNITVDYSIRGIISPEEYNSSNSEETVKRKEDAPKWKQAVWFIRPVYCKVKDIIADIRYVLKHIDHFF